MNMIVNIIVQISGYMNCLGWVWWNICEYYIIIAFCRLICRVSGNLLLLTPQCASLMNIKMKRSLDRITLIHNFCIKHIASESDVATCYVFPHNHVYSEKSCTTWNFIKGHFHLNVLQIIALWSRKWTFLNILDMRLCSF